MRKIKDFFYNSSDIFITLLVLALAGGIIFWRVQVILGYSDMIIASQKNNQPKIDIDFSDIDLEPAKEPEVENEPAEEEPVQELVIDANYKATQKVTFVIESGTPYEKAIRIVASQFGYDDDDYMALFQLLYQRGVELGADYCIMPGTFTIPEGADIDQMIRTISAI